MRVLVLIRVLFGFSLSIFFWMMYFVVWCVCDGVRLMVIDLLGV